MIGKERHALPAKGMVRLTLFVAPVFLLLLNVFVFGPATLYRLNTGEFGIGFFDIITVYGTAFIVSAVILLALGLVLLRRSGELYASIIFALGLLFWVEGNLVIWDYGLFDGIFIEWSGLWWRGIIDGALWLVVIALFIKACKKLSRFIPFISLVLIIVQAVLFVSLQVISPKTFTPEFEVVIAPPRGLYDYSSNFNIVHIILDGFQSDIFEEVVKEDGLGDDLSGFVFFKDNMSVSGGTALAVPAIFSAVPYEGDKAITSYIKEGYEGGFHNDLAEAGFDLKLMPAVTLPTKNKADYYRVPTTYGGTLNDVRRYKAAIMMDLVLFRHLPHYLKRLVYNGQNWTITPRFVGFKELPKTRNASHKSFFSDYINSINVSGERKAYHFLHLLPPHPPFNTTADCGFVEKTRAPNVSNYKLECRCILRMVMEFMGRLKELGIYDETLIILQADHGQGFSVDTPTGVLPRSHSRSLALLTVKRPGADGPMKTTLVESSVLDVAPTVLKEAGVEGRASGRSLFELSPGDKRERIFNNALVVNGSAFDLASWKPVKGGKKKLKLIAEPYALGDKITFDSLGNAEPYQAGGWGQPEEWFTWTVGKSAVLEIPLLAVPENDLTMKIALRPFFVPGRVSEQMVIIKINGKETARWRVKQANVLTGSGPIPKSLIGDSDHLRIEFILPNAASPLSYGMSNDARELGLAIFSLEFN